MTYEEIIEFHGHDCPGLAMGYRMAVAAMESLESIPCAFCGEGVMASRIRQRDAKPICIPCCERERTIDMHTPEGVEQPCP